MRIGWILARVRNSNAGENYRFRRSGTSSCAARFFSEGPFQAGGESMSSISASSFRTHQVDVNALAIHRFVGGSQARLHARCALGILTALALPQAAGLFSTRNASSC